MKQLSLVSMYGEKDKRLQKVVRECNRMILNTPKIKYFPYDIQQAHATIISLERFDTTKTNFNFSKYRNTQEPMDFNGLINALRTERAIPFKVQIGGFQRHDLPFYSWGKSPFERSFQIQSDKAVMIGWPVINSTQLRAYPDTLDRLRGSLQRFNVLHRYHASPNDIDNDFYFRIGLLDSNSTNLVGLEKTTNNIREYLASIEPLIIELTSDNIYFVSYDNETLPNNSTQKWALSNRKVTADFLWEQYN